MANIQLEGPVLKLLDALDEVHRQQRALIDELRRTIGGGVPMGQLLKQSEKRFADLWSGRYPGEYVWSWAKDRPQMKRLITKLGLEELDRRMVNYLRSSDDFFKARRHPFGLFVSTINQHAAKGVEPADDLTLAGGDENGAVADCKHAPPCKSDTEHTRRRNAEMRGESPF